MAIFENENNNKPAGKPAYKPNKAQKQRAKYTFGAFTTDGQPAGFVVLFSKVKKFITKHEGLLPENCFIGNPNKASNGNLRFDFVIGSKEEGYKHVAFYYPHSTMNAETVLAHKKHEELTWSIFNTEERSVSKNTELV